ncbi:carboxyl-terminal PDZ ligand of neuronal nitric oxide synthase protein [Nematostella vectensis]|uniref:carboxyl-terminal PDZ ligand of neuronal nitric oxide synthase protein n=1 Tax=Nematostella vectensis TaxID=45351 RepID=UPI002076E9F0|nr:carboxyl-terminal PDZ ligand of neuronal nitric oxide synthase protein [Nematostella vectensis]
MPGKLKRHEYDLVEEVYDSKIPVHNETAFEHGIRFKVKFIGTKEISKPNSRTEIVAAMRRIRYEYKIQGITKKIVELCVGLEGVHVSHLQTKGSMFQKKKMKEIVETEVATYPIHKIFYVSHDSQDLQIFSYIAKEEDIFKCSVFKASNKSQAVHIVRTIGQAFEVCHKRTTTEAGSKPRESDTAPDKQEHDGTVDEVTNTSPNKNKHNTDSTSTSHESHNAILDGSWKDEDEGSVGLSVEKLRQIFHQQVDHYRQELAAAKLQTNLLNDKLTAETTARIEAQKQVEAVLKQNKELISTVQQLVSQVHSLHAQRNTRSPNSPGIVLAHSNTSSLASTPIMQPRRMESGLLRRNLGEPTLPHIPPPAASPAHSRKHSNASSSSLTSGGIRPSNQTSLQNTTSTSDLEISQAKRDPPPQEFFQFVFDSSVNSDYFVAAEPANTSPNVSEHAQWPIGSSASTMATPNSTPERQDKKKTALNGT